MPHPLHHRPPARIPIAMVGVALFLLAVFVPAAAAHTPLAAGDYQLEVGWLQEPALMNRPNAVQVAITDHDGKPVVDLASGDLSVVVSIAGQDSPRLPLAPVSDEYRAVYVPLSAGTYTFNVVGSIHGTAVDVLYDDAIVQEPYRYLDPTGDQAGSPTSFSKEFDLDGGASPVVVATTSESPAQVQLIAQRGAFQLTPGATSVRVSITPVVASAGPAGGHIAGNVYRILVTDQIGTALSIRPCDGCISLVLLAPEDLGEASIRHYADGAWTDLQTTHAGVVATYQTNVKTLGDFALVAMSEPEAGLNPVVIIGGVALLVLLAGGAFPLLRVRQAPADAPGR